MKIVSLVVILIIIIGGFLFLQTKTQIASTPSQSISPSPSSVDEKVNITVSFTIITDNITRSFKAEKYHNKSADVFITADNPSIVHVKKAGIRWDDFFKTLPMKLTKTCLITGDGETLCDGKDGTLKFYLNDVEDKDLLDKEIKQGDSILIKFTSS